jgi:hypothetical protein
MMRGEQIGDGHAAITPEGSLCDLDAYRALAPLEFIPIDHCQDIFSHLDIKSSTYDAIQVKILFDVGL